MMKIIVCIKSVLRAAPEGSAARTLALSELNPFDRPALALGRRLARETGGRLVALTMGAPASGGDALLEAMALGADDLELVSDRALIGSDTLVTASVLAAAIVRLAPFGLILFGARSLDSDTGHVGPQTAQLLNLPLVTSAVAVARTDAGLAVTRREDGYEQQYELTLPAALTVLPAAAPVEDAPLAGLERAYREGRFRTWTASELGLDPARIGLAGSPTRVLTIRKAVRERRCELIVGTAEEQAEELVKRMRERGVME
jgi:electron transfer flavoprotein beta subunit